MLSGVNRRQMTRWQLDSIGGRILVRWSPDEAVTPLGQLPFFIDFLKQANLFDPFVAASPLQYSSPNAPEVRDVLGTLMLAIVTGGRRYSDVNSLRHDGINPPLLGMSKVCSDDSVRRVLKSGDAGGLDTGRGCHDQTDLWQTGGRGGRLQPTQARAALALLSYLHARQPALGSGCRCHPGE